MLKPLASTDPVTNLEPYISSLELFSASGEQPVSLNISKLILFKKMFLLSGGVVFSAEPDGSGLKRVGNVGRGPGEYLSVKDIAISRASNQLWCLDVYNSILKYDLDGGDFQERIEIGKETGYARALVPLTEGRVGVYFSNPPSASSASDKKRFRCFHVFDEKGKDCKSEMGWSQFHLEAGFSIPSTMSGTEDCTILSPEAAEPSLVFREGRQEEKILFDFGSKTVPEHYFSQHDPWEKIGDLFESDYYKLVSSVYILPKYVYLHASGAGSSSWNFLVPVDGGRGIRWQSQGNITPPIQAVGTDGGALYFPYNDYGLVPSEEETDPLKKAVLRKFGIPACSDGNYLIKVSFGANLQR